MDKWTRIKFQPCVPLGEDGKNITACKKHLDLSRTAATEGMVLLKNSGVLPLKPGTRLALFGNGHVDYIKGGSGSGTVYTKYVKNIYDGFKIKEAEGKVFVFDELSKFIEQDYKQQYANGGYRGWLTETVIPDDMFKRAVEFADTAIVTLTRYSGEGWDRTDFELFDHEIAMLDRVTAAFENVIVLLNAGGTINLQYFQQDKIKALVYSLQAGMEGGLATADLLCGDANFSGKLVDTLAKDLNDYPSSETFGESKDFVRYTDDIYVGYRYFETIPGASEKVLYPFGFGLSYTTFDISNITAEQNGDEIKVCATVTNTGSVAGKEVVQVYYSTPSQKLLTPRLQLAAFQKTSLLKPNESETVCTSFKINAMASYDDCGYLCKSAYVLQQGDYSFFVGNSIRQLCKVDFTYTVSEEFRLVEQLSQRCAPYRLDKRLLADGTYEQLVTGEAKTPEYPELEGISAVAPKDPCKLIDVANGKITLDEFIAQLSTDELISLVGGQPNTGVADTCGMGNLDSYGIPNVMTADGPAGLRIEADHGNIHTTAWPIANLLASTWNTQLVFEIGEATAKEVKENNLGIWLSPALNIHRTPLCGRNFEYFSEDPLISGKMAAAQIKGIQSQKIACSVKHFACNNKETNRMDSDSVVSERALREIYLKGFEIAVKEADPWTIMSSYNLINGIHASESHDLLTKILRDEWGYKGMVTSDWTNTAKHVNEVKAGNDIKMPVGAPDELKSAVEDNTLSRAELELCVKRLLDMILKLD